MSASSYDPRSTTQGGLPAELARLEAQANLSFADELRIFTELGVGPQGVLLEVGSGSGAMTRRLRAALPDVTLISLDINPTLLMHAPADGHRTVADATALPLRDASVDTVLLRYVLQHVADPTAVLEEARRVLRPGGRAVVVDVDSGCWGISDPIFAELGSIHAKVAAAQRSAGGDRAIGRRLTRLLHAAGYIEVGLRLFATCSDGRAMQDFAAHLGPQRLEPLVESGVLSLAEIALATDRWNRFRADPNAWAMLVGFVGFGVRQ